jgi:hypothetical protein
MPGYAQKMAVIMNEYNGIIRTMERKSDVVEVRPERFSTVQRAAQALSRRNADGAVVELFAECMQRLTLLAYERDDDGYVNIDPVTRRILIPLPYGKAGHRRWGITSSESVILREMIQQRQGQTADRPPGLWLYDRTRRCWRLNLFDWDTLQDGQRYWSRWPLTVAEYREARSRRLGNGVGR